MKSYIPNPVDTSDIILSDDLAMLTEKLAKNAHENWSQLRQKDGWSWGTERDDKLKKHPDLIPYEELSEAEKNYDRTTAMETIKVIISLGYKIIK